MQPTLTIANVQPFHAGVYSVSVTNFGGSVVSADAVLVVRPGTSPPAITLQPTSRNVEPGGTIRLTVLATGASPLAYQWRFNGADVTGETGTSLLIHNAQPQHAGIYSVLVSNPFGSVTSADAVVIVTNVFYPAMVNFSNRTPSINAPVFDVDGVTRLEGTNFQAELIAGPTVGTMVPAGPSVGFRTGIVAGYFTGGIRSILNVAGGQTASVQVRAWDRTSGETYESALANGGRAGASLIFTLQTTALPNIPPDLIGLESFSLVQVPVATPLPAVIVPVGMRGDGLMEWELRGTSGERYAIECSPNLADWAAFTIVTLVNGAARFSDQPGTTCTYYRALLLP
jgi:hypothetical protein